MNNAISNIELYNRNTYASLLNYLFEHINEVEVFLLSLAENKDFKSIDELVLIYERIFTKSDLKEFIQFKTERIYKALYLRDPGPHTKGNSYFHLTLLVSSHLDWLDNLYGGMLKRLIKFYKHLFSKIDNFFISQNQDQINKYQNVLLNVKTEVSKFMDFCNHRDLVSKREKLKPEYLSKIPFGGLFYIAHLNNIESILKHGILSHNKAHRNGLVSIDISNQQVNERRNRLETSLSGNIHDFAPLFINPRNPTFYYWCMNESKNNLILLKINPHILLVDNVAFSDGNAAVKTTQFYKNINDFNCLNWEVIHNNYWTNYPDGKRIKCSEVLVKEQIPLYYIDNIFVYSEETLEKIMRLFPNHLGVQLGINKTLYF